MIGYENLTGETFIFFLTGLILARCLVRAEIVGIRKDCYFGIVTVCLGDMKSIVEISCYSDLSKRRDFCIN